MGIKALTQGLKEANVEMSKLAATNAALVETLSPQGGGGGGGGGAGISETGNPPVLNFNTTLVTQVDLGIKNASSGSGGGSGGGAKAEEAFAFFQRFWVNKLAENQKQLVGELKRIRLGISGLGNGVELRMGGN